MSQDGVRRSNRHVQPSARDDDTYECDTNPPPMPRNPPTSARVPTSRTVRVPKCTVGDRYKVTGDQFDEDNNDDEPHPEFFYGVVIAVQKTGCKMLFYGDEVPTRYNSFFGGVTTVPG